MSTGADDKDPNHIDGEAIKLALGCARITAIGDNKVEMLISTPGATELHQFTVGDEFEFALYSLDCTMVRRLSR